MSKIHVLDKHTAELIAAGEVVERPSSVVKEMTENALDAGATVITVEIKDGGTTYIRITDNGSGIAREDVPKAFLRHATSKIQNQSDLDAIATLGFRGEALASIAAVSRLELLTKTKEETFGTRYVIEGGEETEFDDVGCPNGSTFIVRDLFFNTPARMKFLKKNVSEGNAIADVMDRLALSHPEVSFKLIRDGKQTLLTPGDGNLLSSVHAVYGNEFASSLIPVTYEYNGISLSGYTCKPIYARKNRTMQLFFINGRFVKTGTGSAALQEAYKNAIMVGKFPAGVYHLTFPYDQIDVNVHPAKIEVRFSNERMIFDTVYFGVKTALEQGDTRPIMQLVRGSAEVSTSIPAESRLKKASSAFEKPVEPTAKTSPSVRATQTKFNMVAPSQKPVTNHQKPILNDSVTEKTKQNQLFAKPSAPTFKPSVSGNALDILPFTKPNSANQPESLKEPFVEIQDSTDESNIRMIGEAFKTYILVEVDNKILVIDKHAAHERILFDQLKATVATGDAQMLLAPVTLTLRKHEYSLLMENQELLEQAGILLDSFGDSLVRVVGIPMNLESQDVVSLLDEIVSKLDKGSASVTADRLDWLYHSMACKAAVKGGRRTTDEELLSLARRIVTDDSVRYCPHGRPVAMWLTQSQLEKLFGRSGS